MVLLDADANGTLNLFASAPFGGSLYWQPGSGAAFETVYVAWDASTYLDVDPATRGLVSADGNWNFAGRAVVHRGGNVADPPDLEVVGDAFAQTIENVVYVGNPAIWLAIGTRGPKAPTRIALVDANQSGSIGVDRIDTWIDSDDMDGNAAVAIADAGDRDGDGIHELAVGGSAFGSASLAIRFATPLLTPTLEASPEIWSMDVPMSTSPVSTVNAVPMEGADVTGDGAPESLIGSPRASHPGGGLVYVLPYQGPGDHDAEVDHIARIVGEDPQDWTGISGTAADVDGDGTGYLVVGMPSREGDGKAGTAMLFLGPLSGTLTRDDAARVYGGGGLFGQFGADVAIGDLDGDGTLDLVVGAPGHEGETYPDEGAVHLFHDML